MANTTTNTTGAKRRGRPPGTTNKSKYTRRTTTKVNVQLNGLFTSLQALEEAVVKLDELNTRVQGAYRALAFTRQ